MRGKTLLTIAALGVMVASVDAAAASQGRGQGKGQGQGQVRENAGGQAKGQASGRGEENRGARQNGSGRQSQGRGQAQQGQAKGRSQAQAAQAQGAPGQRGRSGEAPGQARASGSRGNVAAPGAARAAAARSYTRTISLNDVPASARRFFSSNRRPQVIAAGALARAHARGVDNELRIVPANGGVTLLNQRGDLLLQLNEARARDLGSWQVNPFDMPVNAGAPSFCQSGAGHPVWGRQWCIDKGFGLGEYQDVRWGRTASIGDIIFGRRVDTGNLGTNVLRGLVGNTVFDRLALHAVTLGYTEPLVGTWVTESTGPQVLLVNSGPAPVAEVIDVNRDGRADMMLVALRPW